MKNISVEVPREGASVHLVLRAGTSSGQAAIVANDDVEVRLVNPVSVSVAQTKPAANGKAPAHDLDSILKRLAKLAAPISGDVANKILEPSASVAHSRLMPTTNSKSATPELGP